MRVCLECGKNYQPKINTKKNKYCFDCRRVVEARKATERSRLKRINEKKVVKVKKSIIVQCENCGQVNIYNDSRKRRFCSNECANKGMKSERKKLGIRKTFGYMTISRF